MRAAAVRRVQRRGRLRGDRRGGGGGGRERPDPATATEVEGTVKWFNPDKGFGFVVCEDGGKDVFVHVSVVERAGLRGLDEGQRLAMKVVKTQKGREATSLSLLDRVFQSLVEVVTGSLKLSSRALCPGSIHQLAPRMTVQTGLRRSGALPRLVAASPAMGRPCR